MTPGHLVVAYHGCDITVRDDLVSGRLLELTPSANDYDWLGPGAYFFEGDPTRAFKFATAAAAAPGRQYTQRPIVTPAVVGAVLCLRRCLDMTTQDGIDEFEEALQGLKAVTAATPGGQMPKNTWSPLQDRSQEVPILRKLDCAVFNTLHSARELETPPLPPYEAVRGAFPQGFELAPHSFRRDSHVQIALREPSCVVGWFLPRGDTLLSEADHYSNSVALSAQTSAPVPKPHAPLP